MVELGSLAAVAAAIRAGKVSPVEVTRHCLERIARLDGRLRAFITVDADGALAAARRLEAEAARGQWRGPLHGVPLAFKDLCAIGGLPTSCGTATPDYFTAAPDCTAVRRLLDAGGVGLGKLNMTELAMGALGDNPHHGHARNPWNPEHCTGGSSSGSGVAIAAGFAVGAIGTDTGGSIRLPAAFCGITGLKPTYGRVSRAGVVTLSWTLDHTGPMARSAEDCAFMLQALAGHDPADPASAREPVPDYLAGLEGGVNGLRVGVVRDYFFEQVEPETVAALERALGELGRLGASVRDVTIPSIHATPSFMVIMLSEAYAYHERDLRTRPELYGLVLREKLMAGGLFRAEEYVQAQRLRAQIREDTARVLETVDVLITPTALGPAPAFKVVHDPDFPFAKSNMGPFNITGLPTLAIPTGFSSAGLPLSMQIAGRPFDEATVLRAGHAYQRATDWHRRRPPIPA